MSQIYLRMQRQILKASKREGFWLPVYPGDTLGESTKGHFLIWMEYEKDNNRFLGTVNLAHRHYHVEAYQYREDKELWHVNDEDVERFIAAECGGNRPQTFEIDGYKGKWLLVISPYT